MLLRFVILLTATSLLNSCATDAPQGDYPPKGNVRLSSIKEPIPKYEVLTKAGNRSPYVVDGKSYTLLPTSKGYREKGIASWYGMKFQGNPTSNGEIFDVYKLTAAHRTLPIPCYARITRLDNRKSIIVRINDRGPFVQNRLIDLSWAAAAKLGFVEAGLAEVEVKVISPNHK